VRRVRLVLLVGGGTATEVPVLPALLQDGLGLRREVLARAAAPGFEAALRADRQAARSLDPD
jgi:hypothetical protein